MSARAASGDPGTVSSSAARGRRRLMVSQVHPDARGACCDPRPAGADGSAAARRLRVAGRRAVGRAGRRAPGPRAPRRCRSTTRRRSSPGRRRARSRTSTRRFAAVVGRSGAQRGHPHRREPVPGAGLRPPRQHGGRRGITQAEAGAVGRQHADRVRIGRPRRSDDRRHLRAQQRHRRHAGRVQARDSSGDTAPIRALKTPHGTFGIAVDDRRNEMFLTTQHDATVVVFRKDAERGRASAAAAAGRRHRPRPIRTASRIDPKKDVFYVANYGSHALRRADREIRTGVPGSGKGRDKANWPLGREYAVPGSGVARRSVDLRSTR